MRMNWLLISILFMVSCKNNVRKEADLQRFCIESIIEKDELHGTVRNHLCKEISLSETIKSYINNLSKEDFSNCPENFTFAFQEHIKAWENMIPVTDNYPDLRGEMHDLFDKIEISKDSVLFKNKLEAIWDSWYAVEAAMKLYINQVK